MGIKVRGVKEVQQKLNRLIDDTSGRKAARAIQSAMLIIGAESATMVPVDTSMLLNSQYREFEIKGTRVTGRVGYSAAYALYVHNASGKLKGQPRAHFGRTSNHSEFGPQKPVEFGGGTGTGKYWDPHGEPQFLTKAVQKTKDQVAAVIKKEMEL